MRQPRGRAAVVLQIRGVAATCWSSPDVLPEETRGLLASVGLGRGQRALDPGGGMHGVAPRAARTADSFG